MAYDEELADRIRAVMSHHDGVSEKKMFGGLAFLVNGNMAAVDTEEALTTWVERGASHAASLPEK